MLVLNYRQIWKHGYWSLVSQKEGGSWFYDNQIFADNCLSLGGRWSFEKGWRSCSHFVCTCFIVVGTRLSKYRQFPMEVCIFVKYSKLGWGGEGKYSTNHFNLDYYCSTWDIHTFATKLLFNMLKWLIKIVDCVIFVLKE